MTAPLLNIFLFIHDAEYLNRVLSGIGTYAFETRKWSIERWTGYFPDSLKMIQKTKPDGIIIGQLQSAWATQLKRTQIPFVTITHHPKQMNVTQVVMDEAAIGRMAAEHFLDRGLTRFAFCGISDTIYSSGRESGFIKTIEQTGREVHLHHAPSSPVNIWQSRKEMQLWISQLPKPVGIFVANDYMASKVAQQCLILGERIPEDVSILGVDNTELSWKLCNPPLSSIETGVERIGYQAADLLARMIAGRKPTRETITVDPVHVVTRQSTDLLAIDDPDISAALRFIRQHADKPIDVSDILYEIPIARRTLERRFKKIIGRTPLDEIRRVHLNHAKQLLVQTDLKLSEIAEQSGFPYLTRLSSTFHKETGMTPSTYRRRFRPAGSNTSHQAIPG